MDWAKTTARRDQSHFSFEICCHRGFTVYRHVGCTMLTWYAAVVTQCIFIGKPWRLVRISYQYNDDRDISRPCWLSLTLAWRHNERDSVSNHQPHDCLLNRLFRRRWKKNIKAPRHWPLCGEFSGDRWIPRTNGQLRGKCFHLMTSSCIQRHYLDA